MARELRGVTHNLGFRTRVADVTEAREALVEALIAIINIETGPALDKFVDIFLKDGDVDSQVCLQIVSIVTPGQNILFRLKEVFERR